MCGIVGMFAAEGIETGTALEREFILQRMLRAIEHRGPDAAGLYQEKGLGIGSVRLSIIDLATGNQPISNEDGSIWVVFNGEIFNYLELRHALQAKGHHFRTQSDTEVLIHLYEEEGIAGITQLNGQFAYALWDRRQAALFLVRDRVGIRPLFYTKRKDTIVFASEIKAILQYPGVTGRLSPHGLSQIFTVWTTLAGQTVFEDIYELPPGHYLRIDRESCKISAYWQLRFPAREEIVQRPLVEIVEEFRGLFADAVRLQLRADVPVAAYLSGGIDSCTTTAFIQKEAAQHLRTFSIGFTAQEFDETSFQQMAQQYFATDHTNILCTDADIAQIFPAVIQHTETPVLRTAPAPMYLLSKLVRENGIKVVITGEGADEILAGYNIFKEALVRRFWARQPDSVIRPALLRLLYPYLPQIQQASTSVLALFFGYQLAATNSLLYSHLLRWHNTARTTRYFSPDLRAQLGDYQPVCAIERQLPAEFAQWPPLSQAQYLETTLFMSNYLLSSQGDRMSMANSVEGRYPFLDHRLIEFCAQLPPTYKLRGLREKHLLKQMMKGQLPEPILQRAKQAYRAPSVAPFLAVDAPEYVHELLSAQSLAQTGLFDVKAVTQFLQKARAGAPVSETDGMALVGILSTQLLHHFFIKRANP